MHKGFLKAGHLPILFASFLYFDLSFMVWVLLGPLGVAVAKDLHLDAAHKGLMVATPVLAGAALRVVLGLLVDPFKAKRATGWQSCAIRSLEPFVEPRCAAADIGMRRRGHFEIANLALAMEIG
jgi:NNP family nitrate/nitrite transporter-like MFS transporter